MAAKRPFRWVPAADGLTSPFTSQAIRAVLSHPAEASAVSCPLSIFNARPRMLIAATESAFAAKPHSTHMKLIGVFRLSLEIWPQQGQVREVFIAGTAMSWPPAQPILYSSWRRYSDHA